MKKGAKAEFDGYLLTEAALAKLIVDSDKAVEMEKVATKRCKLEAKVKLEVERRLCKAGAEAAAMKLKACGRLVEDARVEKSRLLKRCMSRPPWYKGRELFFTIGAIVGGSVCAGASAVARSY